MRRGLWVQDEVGGGRRVIVKDYSAMIAKDGDESDSGEDGCSRRAEKSETFSLQAQFEKWLNKPAKRSTKEISLQHNLK